MSNKILTTDALVNAVKRRIVTPISQITFTNQDIIDVLNEEMDHSIMPHLMSVHEEYLIDWIEYPLILSDSDFAFKIPARAVGNKLRNVCFVNDQGVMTKLTRVEIENLVYFQKIGYQTYSFYVVNDMVNLVNKNTLANANFIRMYFDMSPGKLVSDKYAAKILSIDQPNGKIVVDKIPDNFTIGSQFDFTGAVTPNKLIDWDVTCININSTLNEMYFNPGDLLSTNDNIISGFLELKVGDYITIAGESIVPQVPTELHPLLAQYAAVAILESLGDANAIQIAAARLEKIRLATLNLIDNRIEGSNQKINNFNSPMGQSRLRYRRSYW